MVSLVSYGAGTNSTAMLIGMVMRGEPAPHAILFSDTGGERPKSYAYIDLFSDWLEKQGYPRVITIRVASETLEENCLRRKTLPAIAFGWKTCSQRFKSDPFEKWCNNDGACKAAWARGEKVLKLIGFDADEPGRAGNFDNIKFRNRYPLLEWDWGRDECISQIDRCQLPQPGKSACFFCPNNKPWEVRDLAEEYPDLAARGLAMEANAPVTSIKGLGRYFSWRDVLNQGDLFTGFYDGQPTPCGCYDG